MDQDQRKIARDTDTGAESLRQSAASALRAGRLREAGWLLRTGLLTGELVDDALLDAMAPALGSYTACEPREYPVQDLTPPQAVWLPDGRLGVVATNSNAFYAWDLDGGEHEVLHRRDAIGDLGWWTDHARMEHAFVGPARDTLYLTYGEDLPTGGTAVARCHWIAQPLAGGLEYLGFHGSHDLVGASGGELLGLNTWHSGSVSLHGWTPGDEIPSDDRLLAESIRLAPGTCLRCGHLRTAHPVSRPAHVVHYEQMRTPSSLLEDAAMVPASGVGEVPTPPGTPLVFHTPDGREVVSALPFHGDLQESYRSVAIAWGGRALVRSEDTRSLTLYRHAEVLAQRELPSDLPLDDRWGFVAHPSGWVVALVFSGRDEVVLFDLRDGSERRFELPKYFNGYRLVWGPGGELALLKSKAIVLTPS